jgi:hypothetical protein
MMSSYKGPFAPLLDATYIRTNPWFQNITKLLAGSSKNPTESGSIQMLLIRDGLSLFQSVRKSRFITDGIKMGLREFLSPREWIHTFSRIRDNF